VVRTLPAEAAGDLPAGAMMIAALVPAPYPETGGPRLDPRFLPEREGEMR